ncbi:MAG: translation initiation factor IF-2, partial [Nitrospira sp.]|nr:translation initiation factor IF-2 [Nitrospira sp.]
MRVYELAKQLGMENRDLIPELKRLGIAVASHSSALDEEAVQKALHKLMPGKAKPAPKTTAKGDEDKKDGGVRKAKPAASESDRETVRGAAKTAQKSAPVAAEEPPKLEKKRVLFKRKKTDEELEAEAAAELASSQPHPSAAPSLDRPHEQPMVHEAAVAPALHEEAPAGISAAPPVVEHERLPESSMPAGMAPPVVPPLPQEGKPLAPASAMETGELRGDKKKGAVLPPLVAEAGLRDKLKKIKKTGRARDDEALKFREDAARWQDLRAIPVHRREERSRHLQPSAATEVTKPRKKVIKLAPGLTVKEYAELVGQRPADVIRKLMEMGQMLTLNQAMNPEVALLIAEGLGLKAEVSTEKEGEELL